MSYVGRRFGKLKVLRRTSRREAIGRYLWECRCDCGKIAFVPSNRLLAGNTRSCGCLHRRHGHVKTVNGKMVRSPEYVVWAAIRARCLSKAEPAYRLYGGAGIKMSQRWQKSFLTFLRDMGPRPSLKHSIDRINGKEGYYPWNCRWATAKEQARNQKSNIRYSYRGKKLLLSEWSEIIGIKVSTLRARITLHKWSVEKALTTSVRKKAS